MAQVDGYEKKVVGKKQGDGFGNGVANRKEQTDPTDLQAPRTGRGPGQEAGRDPQTQPQTGGNARVGG